MVRTRTFVAALAMALTLATVAAACSSGGSDSSSDTKPKSTTTEADDAPATTTELPPTALPGEVTVDGKDDISDQGKTAEISIVLDDDSFSPTYIEAAPKAKVTVELENKGKRTHTFTPQDGKPTKLKPGEKATVTVTVPELGTLRFSCDIHGEMGMQGAFYTTPQNTSSTTTQAPTTTTTKPTKGDG